MSVNNINKVAVIAFCCLLVGGAKPVFLLSKALICQGFNAVVSDPTSDMEDGEEGNETGDEHDGDDELFKIISRKLAMLDGSITREKIFVYYLHMFSEHHPQLLTPPPRG